MEEMNLDQELIKKLNISNEGGTTIITVSPVKLTKITGVKILVEVGLLPHLKKVLASMPNRDAANVLGVSLSKIDRLRAALGLRTKYHKNSATTQWRRNKEK
jgi:hypothetical protein